VWIPRKTTLTTNGVHEVPGNLREYYAGGIGTDKSVGRMDGWMDGWRVDGDEGT